MKKDPTVNVHIFLQHVRQWLTPKPRMGRSKAKQNGSQVGPGPYQRHHFCPQLQHLLLVQWVLKRTCSTGYSLVHCLSAAQTFRSHRFPEHLTGDVTLHPCTPAARSSFSEPSYSYPLAAPAVLISTWVIWEDGSAVEKTAHQADLRASSWFDLGAQLTVLTAQGL